MKKFEIGKEYGAKLSGDVRDTVKIINRTAKFATVEYWGKRERKKIEERDRDLYYTIGTEDGYFDNVDIKEYKKAKERLDSDYYKEVENGI